MNRKDYFKSEAGIRAVKKYWTSPKGRYQIYKKNARASNKEFGITLDEFMQFWDKDCVYCGDPIVGIGLDRVDNSVGYIKSNLVPCCSRCNFMKGFSNQQDFLSQVLKIAGRLGR